jgi:hypothetical protein
MIPYFSSCGSGRSPCLRAGFARATVVQILADWLYLNLIGGMYALCFAVITLMI